MARHAGDTWKPSERQAGMFLALLKVDGQEGNTARRLCEITGQSSDGAASTVRSLIRRGLASEGNRDGDRWLGYQLTPAGKQIALDIRRAGSTR